jgi:agmatine/peptidylarginine deiminase
MKDNMKRISLLLLLFLMALACLSAEMISLGSGSNSIDVVSSSGTETILQYRIGRFEKTPVTINGDAWYHITMPKEGITQDKGLPQLPVYNRSIIIDNTALMAVEIYDVQYEDMELPVAPSKGVITRNIDPATVPYTFDKTYTFNSFFPSEIVTLSEPYIMRDFRGIVVRSTPFAYNPVTKVLRVFTSFKVRVHAVGTDTMNILATSRDSISRDFVSLYENRFINWDSFRYTPVDDSFGKLLVICHTNYMSTILPYVNWKIQKGIPTELVQWSTIGTTAAQLQTYIQNRYNADNDISYVQLVGDAPQIPSLSSGGGGSDPTFALVAGSDNYPDIFIGRFSAETAAQVTAQIDKAIAYERDVTTSDTWLSRALGIASAEGGGSQGDNGESDIVHMNGIRTDLLNYGYTSVDQVYDPGAAASTVTTNVNAGRGFINYVGHGADTYWVTTGFSNTNASALTNGTKTPVIMDVACVNGNFVSQTCFAEAWQRNANGGSVAIYASTINQSWNSPMRAQDHFTDLMVAEAKYTVGGLYYNASCDMMDIYGSDGVNMYKTWHIFGDASLSMRSKTPIAMTVTHPSNITTGTTTVNVSTGVANSLVAITYNNTIYGRGFTNSGGSVTITLSSPPTGVLNYTITATAHNRVTYVGTIAQTVASGPWMEVTSANFDDANNDVPEYNESGYFNMVFKNSGTASAANVSATLSCSTNGITITDASHTIGSLGVGSTVNVDNAYAISIANNLANGTVASFTITMTMSGYAPWIYNFSKTINAPALAFGNMTVSDPSGNNNGMLDPGETATLSIVLNNTGAAASLSGIGTLSSATTGITIINGNANFSAITAGGNTNLSFSVSAASSMSEGTLAAFVFNATAGQYAANTTVNVEVGAPMEVVIGNGTSTQSYPIDRYYNYSGHEAIYLASEIGTPGTIKSIGFYKASGTDVNSIDAVTIYMKNTSSTSLATGNYSTAGYTQVYSGTWPNTSTSGWMEVNLNTQFVYDGTNLSILVIKGYQYWTSSYPMWTYSTTATSRARQNRNDDAQPTSLTATTNLPNLKIKIFPAAGMLYPPQNLAATATHASVTLTWQTPVSGSPTAYKVYKNNTALTTLAALTYTDTAVTDGTTYSYKVSAMYGSDESDPTATVNATPNMNAPTNLVATGGNNVVALTWTAAAGREADEFLTLGSKDRAISSYRIYRNGTALTTVSSTSYNDTAVTNGTSYSYYVTTIYTNPAGESGASNTASATPNAISAVVIGTGTSSNDTYSACPVNVWYESLHGQSVYQASELNAAGVSGPIDITQIGFNVTGLPTLAMPNFVVRMGHTTATNVSNWISTGLTTVYSTSSYQPTVTGWNMLTLSTPFTWDGTSNIVIDTAFGVLTSYTASGTTQYTSVTNGYRFIRLDDADQTNVFTGGSTSSYRPNVKLALQSQVSGPAISANPNPVSASAIEGENTSVNVTLSNTGTASLNWSTGSSISSWGTVSPVSGIIAAGGNSVLTLNLSSSGLATGTYNSSLVISSNATNNPSLSIPVNFTVNDSPYPVEPRFVAEWEPATGVIIAYASGFGLPYTMIADLSTRGKVYVVVTSGSQSTASSALSSNGVTMSNVYFINPSGVNTYWTRDYGPWTIMDADGEMGIVDFDYNRVRPYDDALNSMLDDYFGFNYYELPLVATGGNVMTDGQGKMMSTTLILSENDGVQTALVTEYNYTQPQIENLVEQYLGVEDYYFFTDPLSNSTIDHIDCHAKLLDVDKVMIARVPVGHTNYAALEAVVDAWEAKTSSYGTPYQIFRVDQTSNNEPYANSFIYNGKIYVPQWNPTASASDLAAIAAYQAAMPGFTVQGYYLSSFISDDAAHCRVNTIFDEQMVFVKHVPPTSAMASSTLAMNVEITHINALNPSSTYIAYRHSTTGSWQYATLNYISGDLWSANVPTPALGQRLYYYILATDNTARNAKLPLCGANDPFEILVDIPALNTAPTIALPSSFTFAEDGSLIVDFSGYVADNETADSGLTLSYSGNVNVNVAINGMSVTFSATADWYGAEILSFEVSDGLLSANDNVNVIVTSVTDPAIIGVDPLNLEFGVVTVGSSETRQFTITNTGEAALSGSITTPVGYSVAPVSGRSRQANLGVSPEEATSLQGRNTLNFNLASGSVKTYDLSFTPTTEGDYDSYLAISSNDPNQPLVNIALTGNGFIPNSAPVIDLPQSFSFAENGTLIVDFDTYVDDVDDDPLTLSYSGNTHVSVAIDGMMVTFTATADWDGSEVLNFTVSDGEDDSSDTVEVIVNNVNVPPTIELPESFSFDENGSLEVDFAPYVNDADGEALTLGFSGNTDVSVVVDGMMVTFTATADWDGSEVLTFTVSDGNDDASDTVEIIVNNVNRPPTIELPASFSFDENGSIEVDFAPYVNDADGEALTLGYNGNTHVSVAVDGMMVTFTATADWDGFEVLTFTVSDGTDDASDTVEIVVNNVNVPPTIVLPDTFDFDMNSSLEVDFAPYVNDADGEALTLGYSGNTNLGVAIDGMMVTFTAAPDWHGTELITFTVSDGTDFASYDVSVTVNYVVTSLSTPTILVSKESGGIQIDWDPINDANIYIVYRCEQPYGNFVQIGETSGLTWVDTEDLPCAFYYVKACFDPLLGR